MVRLARRKTFDGYIVELHDDGQVTGAMGAVIPGVGLAQSAWARDRDVEAGWLALGDVCLYDMSEVARLVLSARKAVRQRSDAPLRAMRLYFAGKRIQTLKSGATFRWVDAAPGRA